MSGYAFHQPCSLFEGTSAECTFDFRDAEHWVNRRDNIESANVYMELNRYGHATVWVELRELPGWRKVVTLAMIDDVPQVCVEGHDGGVRWYRWHHLRAFTRFPEEVLTKKALSKEG